MAESVVAAVWIGVAWFFRDRGLVVETFLNLAILGSIIIVATHIEKGGR